MLANCPLTPEHRSERYGWMVMIMAMAVAGVTVVLASLVGGKRGGGAVAAIAVCALSSSVQDALRVRRFCPQKA